jgi:predicted SAM-dependent methyltransferase
MKQSSITSANLYSNETQEILRALSLRQREEVALQTGTMVQYYGEEVALVKQAEESAALRAAPAGYDLNCLNGLNIGCGDRSIHPSLLGIDIHKGKWSMGHGSTQEYLSTAHFISLSSELPFKPGSIDYIVALHILEHESDPVGCVLKWLSILKPGGGLGLILPDWRYTWDARNDAHPWSHRWNPTPNLLKEMHQKYWSSHAALEHHDTIEYKLSFDVVLRKNGVFEPFNVNSNGSNPTGRQLFESGHFLHGEE